MVASIDKKESEQLETLACIPTARMRPILKAGKTRKLQYTETSNVRPYVKRHIALVYKP